MKRYLSLFAIQVRISLTIAMQYRVDFLVQGLVSIFWAFTAIFPLFIVFHDARKSIVGWSFPETLVVLGWFTTLKAVLEGAINPSLVALVDNIRKGTLDFVLLKPADSQFLVSTARIEPWRLTDLAAAALMFYYAFSRLGVIPRAANVLGALLMLGIATLLLYSVWIIVISAAFYVVKIDNLTHLFTSIYDAGRWPIDVFSGALRFLFTFVIPLAVMTTYPAQALLGTLKPHVAGASLLGALFFSRVARGTWQLALSKYSSASS